MYGIQTGGGMGAEEPTFENDVFKKLLPSVIASFCKLYVD